MKTSNSTRHTKGPWIPRAYGTNKVDYQVYSPAQCQDVAVLWCSSVRDAARTKADAELIASAPDFRDQLTALFKYGWTVEKTLLYDEEGIEGWRWTTPKGREYCAIGDWNELPPWPQAAQYALADMERGFTHE